MGTDGQELKGESLKGVAKDWSVLLPLLQLRPEIGCSIRSAFQVPTSRQLLSENTK